MQAAEEVVVVQDQERMDYATPIAEADNLVPCMETVGM